MENRLIFRLIRPTLRELAIVLVATLLLILWRVYSPTNLLFDQFCVITLLIFMLSFSINYTTSRNTNLIAKFNIAVAIALVSSLLYFSTIQYTVLAIDRSRSFYVLSWIDNGLFVFEKNQLKLVERELPSRIDLDRNNLAPMNQRIEEQISRKLVTFQDSKLVLTWSGEVLLNLSTVTARVFNLKGWESNTSLPVKIK